VRNSWVKHHRSTVRIKTTIQNLARGLEFHLLVRSIVFLSPFFVPAELREDSSAVFSPLIQRGNSRRTCAILNYHSFYGSLMDRGPRNKQQTTSASYGKARLQYRQDSYRTKKT